MRPPQGIEDEFLANTTEHSRRVDIYEADGKTIFLENAPLVGGSVTVDYDRDERRAFDLSLDNSDGSVTYDPNGFWYDKVLKIYRGIFYNGSYDEFTVTDRNEAYNPSFERDARYWGSQNSYLAFSVDTAWALQGSQSMRVTSSAPNQYWTLAFYPSHVNPTSASSGVGQLKENDYISLRFGVKAAQATTLKLALLGIKSDGTSAGVLDMGTYQLAANEVREFQFIDLQVAFPGAVDATFAFYLYEPNSTSACLASGKYVNIDKVAIYKHGSSPSNWQDIPFATGDMNGARWAGEPGGSATELLRVSTKSEKLLWETQIGEFMIDKINEPHFPQIISVSGRDYSKKLILSKFVAATGFNAGASLSATVNSILSAAGIDSQKRLIPVTSKVLSKDFIFEAGTTRFQAIKDMANAYNYEIFFDAQGFFVMQEFRDPSTSQISYSFKTGEQGNLSNYDKSVNDSRIYNHVVVSGEASDTIPVWAEAKNENPSSPTNIVRIGDRVYTYTSGFITTYAQALETARKFLAIHSLQEFELNFGSLMLPWMEVGEVIEFIDPKAYASQPDRFLLSTLNIGLDLSVMSGSGKRVTVLG